MRTKQWIMRGLLGVVIGWGFAIGSASSAETGKGVTSGASDVSSKATDPGSAKAATPPAPAPQALPTPSEPAASPAVAPPPTKPRSQNDEARTRLNGTNWSLDLIRVSGSEKEKGKSEKDSVTFGTRTVSSDRLSKSGFPTSNYSVNVGDDGVLVWETMQAHSEGKGVAFWRGETHGDKMEGVLSNQPTGGSPEEFSFTGRQIGGAAVSSAEAQTTAAPHAIPVTTTVAEKARTPAPQPASTKKKKR